MNYPEGYTLSDIAAVTDSNRNSGNGMFGNDSWAWLILFILFGFGNRGFGGFGGNQGSGIDTVYVDSAIQRGFDNQSVINKLNGLENGLCDGFYAANTNTLNGFAGVQQSLCSGFANTIAAINTNGYESRLATNDLGYRLSDCCCAIEKSIADCCCTTQRSIDNVNYNMATNTCAITNAVNTGFNGIQQAMCLNTRDVIDNQNANFRALHDEIVANRIEDKNAQIQAQQNEINSLRLAASQERQNNYLVEQLAPKCPIPAFLTCNPFTGQTYTNGYGYGCNNGCGC